MDCFTSVFLWCFQAKEMLTVQLPSWQEKCSEITDVPDTVTTMIEELSPAPTPMPLVEHYNRVSLVAVMATFRNIISWAVFSYHVLLFIPIFKHSSYCKMLQIKAFQKSHMNKPCWQDMPWSLLSCIGADICCSYRLSLMSMGKSCTCSCCSFKVPWLLFCVDIYCYVRGTHSVSITVLAIINSLPWHRLYPDFLGEILVIMSLCLASYLCIC